MASHRYTPCPKFQNDRAEDDATVLPVDESRQCEKSTNLRDNMVMSIPAGQPAKSRLPHYKWWSTEGSMIGMYIIALGCAITHYLFFSYLDARTVGLHDDRTSGATTSISQSYVTTISLLLITAFRAALVGSVGICYTQYLWKTFRNKVLEVSLIEDLFQIQSNAFRFMNYALCVRTPSLVMIMAFSWLIPIATIYPPGALVVRLEPTRFESVFNVSTFGRNTKEHPELLWAGLGQSCTQLPYTQINDLKNECQVLDGPGTGDLGDYLTRDGLGELNLNTRKSLITGKILDFNHHERENSSYTTEFWGIDLDCKSINHTITYLLEQNPNHEAEVHGSTSQWYGSFPAIHVHYNMSPLEPPHPVVPGEQAAENERHYSIPWTDKGTIHIDTALSRILPFQPEQDFLRDNASCSEDLQRIFSPNVTTLNFESDLQVLVPGIRMTCEPKFIKYNVTVAYTKSIREISYRKISVPNVPNYQPNYGIFNGTFELWEEMTNALSIYDSFVQPLQFTIQADGVLQIPSNNTIATGSRALTGGDEEKNCLARFLVQGFSRPTYQYAWGIFWDLTIFGQRTPSTDLVNNTKGFAFADPVIDPVMLQESLANATISALALGRRYQLVNGTTMKEVNIYRFERNLNFFLPYSLCLVLTLPIVIVGLLALYHNGVSAISGGFLQVLVTTTGQTQLREVAAGSCLGGHETISPELLHMKVRFGELIQKSTPFGSAGRQDSSPELSEEHTTEPVSIWKIPVHSTSNNADLGQASLTRASANPNRTPGIDVAAVELTTSCENFYKTGFGTVDETRLLVRRRGVQS